MKQSKIIVLGLLFATIALASPRGNRHHRPVRSSHYYHSYYNSYHYPSSYWRMHYSSPVIIRSQTQTTTTTPQNLVTITAEMITEDLVRLSNMKNQGLISEKDFERAKKTLLNRIGMKFNPEASGLNTSEILDQIIVLHQMQSGQLITNKEFKQQKNNLLALI